MITLFKKYTQACMGKPVQDVLEKGCIYKHPAGNAAIALPQSIQPFTIYKHAGKNRRCVSTAIPTRVWTGILVGKTVHTKIISTAYDIYI